MPPYYLWPHGHSQSPQQGQSSYAFSAAADAVLMLAASRWDSSANQRTLGCSDCLDFHLCPQKTKCLSKALALFFNLLMSLASSQEHGKGSRGMQTVDHHIPHGYWELHQAPASTT